MMPTICTVFTSAQFRKHKTAAAPRLFCTDQASTLRERLLERKPTVPARTSGKTALKLRHFLYISSGSSILTRKSPHTVKMTKLQAGGESSNIIPGKASFSLDLRAQTNEAMEALIAETERACEAPPPHSAQRSTCKKNTAFLQRHKTKKLKRSWQKPLRKSSG